MKRKIIIRIIISLFFLLYLFNPMTVGLSIKKYNINTSYSLNLEEKNTLYVGGIGPNNYTNITYAVDDASNGDTVFVYSGTYYEFIRISKSLTLIGENKESTVINCLDKMDVIKISGDKVTIKGFTIKDAGQNFWNKVDAGVEISKNCNNITIEDNIITKGYCGILLQHSNNVSILNNIFHNNNGPSIWLLGEGKNNNVLGNKIIRKTNEKGGGIWLEKSSNNTIKNNNFTNAGIFIFGDKINHFTQKIKNNKVNNKQLLYLKNQNNIKIPNNSSNIILVNCSNITLKDRNATNVEAAVSLAFCSNIKIINSNFSHSNGGISLVYSNNCLIQNNSITNVGDGIKFRYSNENIIENNQIKANRLGIEVIKSNNNLFTKNTVSTNYGLRNIELLDSYENYVYHNNFYVYKKYSNILHYIAVDTGINYWDDGNLGNYWWDYKEKYQNIKNNGIVYEKPYKIVTKNNKDNYPLVEPIGINSNAPNKPNYINGPILGKKNTEYYFNTSTIDPDGDEIYYLFDWGDKTNSGWMGPYNSGSIVLFNKTWKNVGFYKVRVKAKDVYGFESEWSDPLRIIMPKEKETSRPLFIEFLKNIFNFLKNLNKVS